MSYYTLADDGRTTVPASDVVDWGRWFEKSKRHVADDRIGGLRVSTVFLGIDHNLFGDGPPLLFETMIFGSDEFEDFQERYATWDEAEAGHKAACDQARRFENEKKE